MNANSNHLLSLKVLRLSKPSLHAILEEQEQELVSDFLTLPPSFGNIYLGETFDCYLSIINDSSITAKDVALKAELQTQTQRFTLADSISLGEEKGINRIDQVPLMPKQTLDFILHHEIKEIGIHILVCSVNYTSTATYQENERKFFRKFFKFQVSNPLAFNSKVFTQKDGISKDILTSGIVYVEIQLQNLASTTLVLDRLDFKQNKLFDVKRVDEVDNTDSSIFDKYLNAGDIVFYN
jgi:hypothetical protein